MKNYFKLSAICICCVALACSSSAALSQAASIGVGETDFVPQVQFEFFQSNNAFRTTGNEVPTNGAAVSPTLAWAASSRLTDLEATYRGKFSNANVLGLSFADHRVEFRGNTEFSKRSRIRGEALYSISHEPLGTGLSFGLGGELENQNEFSDFRVNLTHTYGVDQARANIETGLTIIDRQFINNSFLTSGQDRINVNPNITFSMRASGTTRLFIDAQYSFIDYDADQLDGASLGLFFGTSWDRGGNTNGRIKIGQLIRSYSNSDREDTALGVEVDLSYTFSPVSRITLGINRSFIGTDDIGSLEQGIETVATTVDFNWQYSWNSRIEHSLSFNSVGKEADCPAIDTDFNQISLDLSYKFRRFISFGFGIDSGTAVGTPCSSEPNDNPDFNRQAARFFIDMSL